MSNLPEVKIGVVAVSRDCFPESLSVNRRKALMKAYTEKYGADSVYECPVCIVESEIHMVQALEDIKKAGCNALCVYLGNFGPEISETLLAKHFDGPAMFIAAAEETQKADGVLMVGGRGVDDNTLSRSIVAPVGSGDRLTRRAINDLPPAGNVIVVVDLHQLTADACHQGDGQRTAFSGVKRRHNVALLGFVGEIGRAHV